MYQDVLLACKYERTKKVEEMFNHCKMYLSISKHILSPLQLTIAFSAAALSRKRVPRLKGYG